MPADDNQKVEDALQAIRSLVEANGLHPSADDGVIQLDSIVWRGNAEDQQTAPHNDSEMASDTLPVLPQSMSGFATMTALAEEAEQTPADTLYTDDAMQADIVAQPVQPDSAPLVSSFAAEPVAQEPQTGRELAETRALLAEFQSLLDSTIKQQEQMNSAAPAAPVPHSEAPVSQPVSGPHDRPHDAPHAVQANTADDLAAQADAAEAMSTLAKAALDARLSTPHIPAAPVQQAQMDQAPAVESPAERADKIATAETSAPQNQSDSSSAGSISKMALHLVDAAESSDETGNHLFTSAVRSTMQEIIRRQMTEWLTANMTDIIEDALRDEMRPAKSTRRFDRDR